MKGKRKAEKEKVFFEARNGDVRIINDDFLTTTLIEESSIDLIVTSPPYNVGVRYNSFQDGIPYEKYLEFTEKWLRKAFVLAKPDGRMCLNVPLDKSKGRREAGFQSVYADVVNVAKKVGWKYFSTIIWNEGNVSRRTAWGSWLSARAPYVIAPVEVIVIFYKERWQKVKKRKIGRNEGRVRGTDQWSVDVSRRKQKEGRTPSTFSCGVTEEVY